MINSHHHLFPITTTIQNNTLWIGGCDLALLAHEHGTPLYMLDAATIKAIIDQYSVAFHSCYPVQTSIHYASKAMLNVNLARFMVEHGTGLDVVSAGELAMAQRAGVDLRHVHLHGNATPQHELRHAIEADIGRIVVDNLDQLETLIALTSNRATPQTILLRIAPDIDDGAHAHIRTGSAAAKFGMPIGDGTAERAVRRALQAPNLNLVGIHAHIGSQMRDFNNISMTIERLLTFAAQLRADIGWTLSELSPGGGLAVAYMPQDHAGDIEKYAQTIATAVQTSCVRHQLPLPRLIVEPGRSLIARAGVAIYTVTGRKTIHGGNDYLHIDGGMGDNARPALYNAQYTAMLVNKASDEATTTVQIAGRYCESGDILIKSVNLPPANVGDLLAVPVAGAYTLSMSSNYNGVPRPALLLLENGNAHVWQRRETYEDLMRRDQNFSHDTHKWVPDECSRIIF